jgi:YVTN family beta-propeller protein
MYTHSYRISSAALLLFCACGTADDAAEDTYDAGVDAAADAGTETPDATGDDAPDAAPWVEPANTVGRKAYVGLFGEGALAVVDLTQRRVLKTLPVSAPDGLVITPDGKKVYVASADTGSVKVVSTADDTISASLQVGAKPAGLAITPDGRLLVVAVGGADEAVVVDVASDAIVRHVAVGQAHASCISADGHYAYVGSQVASAPAVVKVDLTQDLPPTTFAVDKSPRMLACEPNGIYFSAVGLDALERLDPGTGALAAAIPSGGSPHDVRASEPGKTELLVSQTAGDLEFVDVASATVVAKVPTGKLPHWITLSADRSEAYVTNEGDDNIAIVDLVGKVVTGTFSVGKAPRKMAIAP